MRSGSAAAKGMAPSVMKDKPKIKFVRPDCRWTSVNLFLNSNDAKAIANEGILCSDKSVFN